MTFRSYLQKRSTGYYFRLRVPKHEVARLGKNEIICSLRTKDITEAKARCLELSLTFAKGFDNIAIDYRKRLYRDKTLSPSSTPVVQSKNDISLSELLNAWAHHKNIRTEQQRRQSAIYQETERTVKTFIQHHKDLSISSVTKEMILGLKGYYSDQGLTPITIRKYLGRIGALLRFAESNGYLDKLTIPAGAFSVAVRSNRSGESQGRQPFSNDLLKALFNSPVYTGHKVINRSSVHHIRTHKGDTILKDALYWLPLIGLYSGLRIEEIAQLTLENVIKENGTWYFNIVESTDTQRLKTSSSVRKVPLHYELINFGFLEYYNSLDGSRCLMLFPELKRSVDGKWSKSISRNFGRYLDRIGRKDKNVSFHSFRHSFKDACRNAGLDREIHDRLTGHNDGSVSSRYGAGFSLPKLKEAVDKVFYDIDLSHLYITEKPIKPTRPEAAARLAQSKTPHWIRLSDAYKASLKRFYGNGFDVENVLKLLHDNKIHKYGLRRDMNHEDLIQNHPLTAATNWEDKYKPMAMEEANKAREVRGLLLKALQHDEIKYSCTTGKGITDFTYKPRWLSRYPDVKIYFADSLIDVAEEGITHEYLVMIEEDSYKNWLRRMQPAVEIT